MHYQPSLLTSINVSLQSTIWISEVLSSINHTMGKFYPSITPDLHDWTLRQSVFFVASAPLRGKHINVSPKGLPNASFAILGPNEAAYIDATGSGSETICHLREKWPDNGPLLLLRRCAAHPAPLLFWLGDRVGSARVRGLSRTHGE